MHAAMNMMCTILATKSQLASLSRSIAFTKPDSDDSISGPYIRCVLLTINQLVLNE